MKPLFDAEPPISAYNPKPLFEEEKSTMLAQSSSRLVRKINNGDVEFLADDFSIVCETNGNPKKSVVEKLAALFESNESTEKPERKALFYPDSNPSKKTVKQQVNSLFGYGEDQPPITYVCAALEAAAQGKPAPTIVTKPLRPVLTDDALPVVQTFYRNHHLLSGKSESFVLMVQETDRKINLDTAVAVVQFGSDIQNAIGKFLEKSSGYGTQLTTIGLAESTEKIIAAMSTLAVDRFMGKKKTGFFSSGEYTVNDFINAFQKADTELVELIDDAEKQARKIIQMMDQCNAMVGEHATLVDRLDATIIAGKIVMERCRAKVFKENNDQFLIDQFDNRLLQLATYENLCIVSFEQIKLLQRQMINVASTTQNVATVMYPLWKTAVTTLLTRWQSTGNMKRDTTIPSLMNDTEFVSITKQTETIINALNQKDKP